MLGKYRVLDPLGRGGMARVYRAYHPRLDRYVAIKVMRTDLVDDPEFLARFQREARAIAALRHPHIVQVHDFDVHEDIYYMVMELLEGDTLKARHNDYRSRDEQMPLGETVRILLDVLDGLEYAHREGMIHRDIKPANIMLTKRGQAVLTDFGIAQIVGGTRYTVSGALMGTLNYMAPEQGLQGQCDARCDIYSLGIVFYEMLTQSVPFDADTPLAILMKHLNDPLPLPSEANPDIPEPFERVVLKALAKQPEDRYSTAGEMADALRTAALEAGVQLPDRVSLPRSFVAANDPSESIAVFSGTARSDIENDRFAGDETDATLGEQLEQEPAYEMAVKVAGLSTPQPAQKPAREPVPAPAQVATAPRQALAPVLSVVGTVVNALSSAIARAAPGFDRFLTTESRGRVPKALLTGLGTVAGYNLLAVWIGGLSGRWGLFRTGWPLELLAISIGLFLIMYALNIVWLLIPAGILLGNGLLFSYCQLSGRWEHWAFLWPLEPIVIGGSIWLTFRLAKDKQSRAMIRPVGCALGMATAAWSVLIAIGSMVVDLIVHIGQ